MRRIAADLIALVLLSVAAALWPGLVYAGYRSAVLDVEALPVMLPTSGLHELEPLVDRPGSFRWSDGVAMLAPPNPGGRLLLRLELSSGSVGVTPVELDAGNLRQRFVVWPGLRVYRLLAPSQPGERVMLILRSPTFEVSQRQLGVVIVRLLIAGDGPAPPLLLAALLFASLSGYGLLRRAGLAVPWAAAAILGMQMTTCIWQAAGAWRYALLGGLLILGGGGALGALLVERRWPPLLPVAPHPLVWTRRDRLALGGLLALALALCLPWLAAPDPVGDLELAARRMGVLLRDGLAEAFSSGGDYLPLRLYLLRLLAPLVQLLGGSFYDPVTPITHVLIKLPSLTALLLTVALIYRWSRAYGGTARAALLAGLYAVAPPVWINVAWWGQVDVLLTFPMLVAVALLDRWRGQVSWFAWAVALLIKPQAIILAPLQYAATLRRHGPRGLLTGGLITLALIVVASAPFVLIGQGPGLYQAAVGAVGRFPQATNRAYNLWWLVVGDQLISNQTTWAGLSYRAIGFLLVGLVALLVMLAVLRNPAGPLRALGAAVLALAFFVLPTQIHERYAFFVLPFLLLAAAADLRLLLPFAVLVITSTLNILGAIGGFAPPFTGAIRASPLPELTAWANLIVLLALLIVLFVPPRGLRHADHGI